MQQRNSSRFLSRLWGFFNRGRANNSDGALVGSQRPLRFASRRLSAHLLEIPDTPIRPIAGTLTNSIELAEMLTWCREARDALLTMSKDAFQNIEGGSESWIVASENAEVVQIAEELQKRKNNGVPVIGGLRLKRAIYNMLAYGDAFLELGFERDFNGVWCIADSNYLPSLSVFIDESDTGKRAAYRQQTSLQMREDDRVIHPVKMLHFQYDEAGIYGTPLLLPSLEPWRKVKEVSVDIEDASRALGMSPWVHLMPDGVSEEYRQGYRQDIEAQREDGIITDLYLMPGGDLRKAANDTELQPLIDYWLQLRYQCVPTTFPIWMYPGLGLESAAGKDIANQPALAYARTIAHIRSVVAEQLEFAVAVELVLRKGWDWYEANGQFSIEWSKWFVTGMEEGVMHQ
jgi:hypothetical protein